MIDTTDRVRLLLTTTILTALALTITFVLTALGLVRLPHLLVLAALSNTFRVRRAEPAVADSGAGRAGTPVQRHHARFIPWQAGRMIGPSIAGILIAAFGGAVGLAMSAVASYVALVLYSRLR